MKKRRMLALLLCGAMALSAFGCSSNKSDKSSDDDDEIEVEEEIEIEESKREIEISESEDGELYNDEQETAEDNLKYSEGLEFESNGNGTASVVGIGTCPDSEVVIPSVTPDGDDVTSIGDYAFEFCSSLTSIEIPEGVTYYGNDALP